MPSPQQTGAVHEAHASSSGPALHEANRESFHSPKGVSQPLPPSSPAAPGRESPHREPVPITGRKHGEIRTVPDSSFHLSVKLRVQSLRPLVTVRSLPRSGKVLTEQPQSADKTAEFTCAKSSSRARHPAAGNRSVFSPRSCPGGGGRVPGDRLRRLAALQYHRLRLPRLRVVSAGMGCGERGAPGEDAAGRAPRSCRVTAGTATGARAPRCERRWETAALRCSRS